ncbi:MAG TPA: hypothetical protein VH740_07285 [Vicinamibacterales bacterium]|jgi:hypothetical protein
MDAIGEWHALLRPTEELTPRFTSAFAAAMRERKLTFGTRVHCPFLRPFFLSADDEARIVAAAETIAAVGERVVRAAFADDDLYDQLGMTEREDALVDIDPGYPTASTASRLDAFLLPESLHFAEYNAESPAGIGYTQRLCELFESTSMMASFRETHTVRYHKVIDGMLRALIESYREWGGAAQPPTIAIVDWREVPTWTEFEILRDAFVAAGVPTLVCDPRELVYLNGTLIAQGSKIDLVYRRVLVNDVVARPAECRALVDACAARAVCMANSFRCKLAHKKAFFAVLTDPEHESLFSAAERDVIRAHVPWTRVLDDVSATKGEWHGDLLELVRAERERMVLKPNDEYGGTGVTLGWETPEGAWQEKIESALEDPYGTWVVQERIPVRREVFPRFDATGRVSMTDMLVDFAPYLFRGKMGGYLTRLSGSGLANVTSGGGQVPAFVVE